MKNRDYKTFGEGEFFHIYNRGNRKEEVFLDEDDYRFFLIRLKQNLFPNKELTPRACLLPDNSFSLISYCIMPNHFHLLLKQNTSLPTSKLLLRLCTSYSMYFNKKYQRVGHVFQDRFKQILIDNNKYLVWLSAYIHQNPQIANIINDPSKYKWSSYREYLGLDQAYIASGDIILSQFKNTDDYKNYVNGSLISIKNNKIDKCLGHLLLD